MRKVLLLITLILSSFVFLPNVFAHRETIILQQPDTENLEDTYVNRHDSITNYGNLWYLFLEGDYHGDAYSEDARVYIKFNITKLLNTNIERAEFGLSYVRMTGSCGGNLPPEIRFNAYHVYNQIWTEESLTWNNQLCGIYFNNSEQCDVSSPVDTLVNDFDDLNFLVTAALSKDIQNYKSNFSIAVKLNPCMWQCRHYSKEGGGISFSPYLNVTYTYPPTLTILSPENIIYASSSVPLTFTIDEPTSWIGYSLDNQQNVTITGNTTLNGLIDGSHNVIVYANDTSGNMGESNNVYFAVLIPTTTTTSTSTTTTTTSTSTSTTTSISTTSTSISTTSTTTSTTTTTRPSTTTTVPKCVCTAWKNTYRCCHSSKPPYLSSYWIRTCTPKGCDKEEKCMKTRFCWGLKNTKPPFSFEYYFNWY